MPGITAIYSQCTKVGVPDASKAPGYVNVQYIYLTIYISLLLLANHLKFYRSTRRRVKSLAQIRSAVQLSLQYSIESCPSREQLSGPVDFSAVNPGHVNERDLTIDTSRHAFSPIVSRVISFTLNERIGLLLLPVR